MKTVCPKGRMGSNPILSAGDNSKRNTILYNSRYSATLGEVPKLAEGTPLERVQVVNSGARVQIPPSPLARSIMGDQKYLIKKECQKK